MQYLNPDEFFIEAISGPRYGEIGDEYQVKQVGFDKPTWEPKKNINKSIRDLLEAKVKCGLERKLGPNELWDQFFDDEDATIFETKAAKAAFTCHTDKDIDLTNFKKRNRVAAICIGVGANGVVEMSHVLPEIITLEVPY